MVMIDELGDEKKKLNIQLEKTRQQINNYLLEAGKISMVFECLCWPLCDFPYIYLFFNGFSIKNTVFFHFKL